MEPKSGMTTLISVVAVLVHERLSSQIGVEDDA